MSIDAVGLTPATVPVRRSGEEFNVPYLRNIVAVSERTLRDDSGTVARFVAELVEGMQFNRNKANKDESMRILAKYLRVPLHKNSAMIEEGYETYRDMS